MMTMVPIMPSVLAPISSSCVRRCCRRCRRSLGCGDRRRLLGVGRLAALVAVLLVGLTHAPAGAGDGGDPGDDAEHGHSDEDEGEGAGHAGSFSFSTFWLTTCDEPPGAIVTP